MPLVTTSELVAVAHTGGHGVPAFNVVTLEHAEGIAMGAEAAGVPAILQISHNTVRFRRDRPEPIGAACAAVARGARVPLSVHLDHVEDEALLHATTAAGASSAMFDASRLDDAGNVAATRRAAEWARRHGVWLEAELGEIGGKGAHVSGARTDPGDAAEFVRATGVDALAVAVGSSHAMTSRTAELDLDLVAELRAAVPVPLVLHGSSGVPDEQLRAAVARGIVKVNIGTLLNVAYSGALRGALTGDDPRAALGAARDEIAEVVEHLARVVVG